MLGPVKTLWRDSLGLYLRTSASVLEYAAEGLKNVESVVGGDRSASRVDLSRPLDPESAEGQKLLADLQGNILRGHGRDHAMHLFICFGRPNSESAHAASVRKIRSWIRGMTEDHVTTAAAQLEDIAKKDTFTVFLLSSHGYEFLGERRPRDGAFREGMRDRSSRLNDPPFDQWQDRYRLRAEDIHALVIVAAREAAVLERMKATIEAGLRMTDGFVLVDERGSQERDQSPRRRAIEHFGYADGVSQPRLIDKDSPRARNYDQRAPLKLVLERDRHGGGGYGSYLVYRKLEQNVKTFNAAVERVAKKLGESPELAGAMAIGRFKNGTPLTTHGDSKPGYDPKQDEDFDYDHDENGNRCPLHAHIRKVNPRGSLGFLVNLLAREQKRRIARRGITYTEGDGEERKVGLLFMCFQSDIRDQFEFIQRSWANNDDFSEPGTGLDPVMGQSAGSSAAADAQNWPAGYGASDRKSIRFDEHVKLLGGEYFFAPSLSGLRELGRSA